MKIHTQPDQLGGVWANAAAVRHSPHEFTIDFLRCDFDDNGQAINGLLVQRINMSPLFVTQLIAGPAGQLVEVRRQGAPARHRRRLPDRAPGRAQSDLPNTDG